MSPNERRAAEVLAAHPLIDGHNDLPWAHRQKAGYDLEALDVAQPQPDLHTDIPRLRSGGIGGQFWSVYVPCRFTGDEAISGTLEQIDFVRSLVRRYPDTFAAARTADDVENAFASGRIASLLGAEGGHSINSSLGTLRMLFELGVRYLTLTHNDNLPWADSATDTPVLGGLSDFGRQVVAEMNRLGMLVDLSHVSADTMRAALACTRAPVIFSHSSARAVCDVPRNVPDDVLAKLPDNGGVCMVTFVSEFVHPPAAEWRSNAAAAAREAGIDPTDLSAFFEFTSSWRIDNPKPRGSISSVVAHLEHVRSVAGIDHIGLGGDYDGTDVLPEGLEDVSGYPRLFGALLDRGWSESDLIKLAGGNVLRVMRAAERAAE